MITFLCILVFWLALSAYVSLRLGRWLGYIERRGREQ
jgi:hypothetical protein